MLRISHIHIAGRFAICQSVWAATWSPAGPASQTMRLERGLTQRDVAA